MLLYIKQSLEPGRDLPSKRSCCCFFATLISSEGYVETKPMDISSQRGDLIAYALVTFGSLFGSLTEFGK